jgi:hypothetical protein
MSRAAPADTGDTARTAHPALTANLPDSPALAAARLRLQASHAALAAALRGGKPGSDAVAGAAGAPQPAGAPLFAQLAGQALAPWAEQRPWTLVTLAAAAGALLASRRGRGLLGTVAMAALLAPTPRRRGLQLLGQGVAMALRRPAGPRP